MTDVFSKNTRLFILRSLYALDVSRIGERELLNNLWLSLHEEEKDLHRIWPEIKDAVIAFRKVQPEIDAEIQRLCPRWQIDRMAVVDRNLLRLGLFEIQRTPHAALLIINACVDLAKEYGSSSTPGFINGHLDQYCKDHQIARKS